MNDKIYLNTPKTEYSDINGLDSKAAGTLNWIYILGQADLVENANKKIINI